MQKHAIALMAMAMLAVQGHGQEASALPLGDASGKLVLSAAGHKVTMPFPDWLSQQAPDAAALRELATVTFVDDGNQADLQIYPRGEGEAFWTTLYGARIVEQADAVLSDLRSVVINVYARTCEPEAVALFQLEPDSGDTIPPLGFVCGSYLDLPGYEGLGEVMVMGFYKSAAGAAMVYQQWRGDAFNAADPASWPVSTDVIEERIAQFKTEASLAADDRAQTDMRFLH